MFYGRLPIFCDGFQFCEVYFLADDNMRRAKTDSGCTVLEHRLEKGEVMVIKTVWKYQFIIVPLTFRVE